MINVQNQKKITLQNVGPNCFWIAVPPNSLNIPKCSPGLLFVSLYLNPLLSRRSKFSNDCCHLNVTWSCREMRDRNCSLVVNSCGFTVRNLRVPNPLQKFRNAQTPEPMITHIQGLNSAGSRIRQLRLGILHLCLGIRHPSWEIRWNFAAQYPVGQHSSRQLQMCI